MDFLNKYSKRLFELISTVCRQRLSTDNNEIVIVLYLILYNNFYLYHVVFILKCNCISNAVVTW